MLVPQVAHMGDPVRLRIRCSEETRKEWRKVWSQYDVTYGEFALALARLAQKNETKLKRELHNVQR